MFEQRFMPGDVTRDLDAEDFLWRIKNSYEGKPEFDDSDRYRTFLNFKEGKVKIYKRKLYGGPQIGECVIISESHNFIRQIRLRLENLIDIPLSACGPVYDI